MECVRHGSVNTSIWQDCTGLIVEDMRRGKETEKEAALYSDETSKKVFREKSMRM